MLVHPAGQTKSGTLSNYIAGYYAKRCSAQGASLYIALIEIHRFTFSLVKTKEAQAILH